MANASNSFSFILQFKIVMFYNKYNKCIEERLKTLRGLCYKNIIGTNKKCYHWEISIIQWFCPKTSIIQFKTNNALRLALTASPSCIRLFFVQLIWLPFFMFRWFLVDFLYNCWPQTDTEGLRSFNASVTFVIHQITLFYIKLKPPNNWSPPPPFDICRLHPSLVPLKHHSQMSK